MITLNATFITDLNRCFGIVNNYVTADAPDTVTDELIGSDLVDAINGNFTKLDDVAPSVNKQMFIGMTGAQLQSYINDNFTTKATVLNTTDPQIRALLNINQNVMGIYNAFDLTTITKDESDIVSRWNDQLGSGHDFITGNCLWSVTDGMKFNAIDQYLKTAQWVIALQPFMVYMLVRQNSWTSGKCIFNGYTASTCGVKQYADIEGCFIRAGAGSDSNLNYGLGLEEWGVIRVLYDGANSFLKVNDSVPINGTSAGPTYWDCGAHEPLGFCIGAFSNGTNPSKIDVQGIIICKATQSEADEEAINTYFKNEYMSKYRFDSGKLVFGWDGDLMNYIWTGHSILHEYGIKDTLFMCGHGGGGLYNAAMWNIVATMVANGTEIQEHGYDHPRFTELTEQQLIDNLAAMDNVLNTEQGYDLPMHVAYPYGSSNNLVRSTVATYKNTGRGIREVQLLGTTTQKYDLPGIGIGLNTPEGIQLIKDQVDYAIANKTAFILYCHGIDEITGGPNAATLTTIAQYIQASGIEIINHSELYALLD